MLHILSLVISVFVVIVGVYVLAAGDWRMFGLKFAGVALSTLSALWILGSDVAFGLPAVCTLSAHSAQCLMIELYYVVRNLAILIFHISIGRDAIQLKKFDRRGALCKKTSTNQSYP